jgi:hypothetical protein
MHFVMQIGHDVETLNVQLLDIVYSLEPHHILENEKVNNNIPFFS